MYDLAANGDFRFRAPALALTLDQTFGEWGHVLGFQVGEGEAQVGFLIGAEHGAGLAGLTDRVKDSFDPKRILNPGRMYAGV